MGFIQRNAVDGFQIIEIKTLVFSCRIIGIKTTTSVHLFMNEVILVALAESGFTGGL